jgi:hypothetical protein
MQSVFTPGNAYTVLRAIAECVSAALCSAGSETASDE